MMSLVSWWLCGILVSCAVTEAPPGPSGGWGYALADWEVCRVCLRGPYGIELHQPWECGYCDPEPPTPVLDGEIDEVWLDSPLWGPQSCRECQFDLTGECTRCFDADGTVNYIRSPGGYGKCQWSEG